MNAMIEHVETAEQPERDLHAELKAARARLTPKRKRLLDTLPENDFQPWRAGLAMGYSRSFMQETLADQKFRKALAILEEIATEDLCITTRRLLREYARIAFADVRKIFDADGAMCTPADLDDDTAAAVVSVETEERFEGRGEDRENYTVRKVRMHSKLEALRALSQYKHLIVDRHEITGKDGQPLPSMGMLVVPGVMREEDWEKLAAKSQEDLAEKERKLASDGRTA